MNYLYLLKLKDLILEGITKTPIKQKKH